MSDLKKNSLIGIAIFTLILATGTCNAQLHSAFLPQKENAIRDWCQMQQRVILGAIEMYNMDNPEMITILNDVLVREPGLLIPKYLRTPIENNYGCGYSSQGNMSRDGYIQCVRHGAESTVDSAAQALDDFKKAAQQLIASGCTVDGVDADGTTALHMAVENNEPLIVDYLISLKADPALKNNQGKNALDLAVEQQNLRIARLLKCPGVIPGQSGKAQLRPEFHPNFEELDGNVQVKNGDDWQPLNRTATYTFPLTLRTGSESRVLFSLGKIDYAFLNIDLGEFARLLGNGLSLELREESELVIEKPVFDQDFPIVSGLPFHLKNGEIRISASSFTGKNPLPTFQMGKNMAVQCQSGTFKFVYDSARDSGKLVVKIGSVKATPLNSSEEGLEITGFYKVLFAKGKLGERQQADIAEEFQ